MYRHVVAFIALMAVARAYPALIFTQSLQPLGVVYAEPNEHVRPHPSVEINAESESLLPREYLKSRDFYDNPAIAADLAKESWFTNKEMLVLERESEKIPRDKIYHIVKNAGFLDRH